MIALGASILLAMDVALDVTLDVAIQQDNHHVLISVLTEALIRRNQFFATCTQQFHQLFYELTVCRAALNAGPATNDMWGFTFVRSFVGVS